MRAKRKIRIGIYGYGNLGRGAEMAADAAPDMELVGIFTRRSPESIATVSGAAVYHDSSLCEFLDKIDVLILCSGSATDLPEMTPKMASLFSVVDSFDTHAKIPEHFERVNRAAREAGKLALISAGWDPGLFSLARVIFSSVLPDGVDYTFWGRGISQGHSDAIRRIDGVLDARQYTVPKPEALSLVRGGGAPELTTRDKHLRECFVVAKEGADKARIEEEIKSMPNYFADYDTTVSFIDESELREKHGGMPHGGSVIRNGALGECGEFGTSLELSLSLGSNPAFTGSVLVAYARAVYRMKKRGRRGAVTVFDIAPSDLSPESAEEQRKHLL